jgi:hypothetical protein
VTTAVAERNNVAKTTILHACSTEALAATFLSTVLDGLAIRGSTAKTAQGKVSEWLRQIGILE